MGAITSDSIEAIESIVNKRRDAEVFDAHAMPDGRVRIFCAKTGEMRFADIPSPQITATVNSVADLIEAEKLYVDHEYSQATIWVETNQAVLFPNSERKAKIVLPLRVNPAIAVLGQLKNLQPKALHRKLKVDLFATEVSPFDFSETIGSLKFETTDSTEVKIRKGDESIAKNVRSKVTGEMDVPDDVYFEFVFYPDLRVGSEVSIACAVITEPAEGTISVIPYPGEIERATINSVQKVADAIKEALAEGSETKVFCGKC
jgi:hypothetical protein